MQIDQVKEAGNYVLIFTNKEGQVIYRYETPDCMLVQNVRRESWWLYHNWMKFREAASEASPWVKFDMLCNATGFRLHTGIHAVIFSEIEKCYIPK